MEINTDTLSLLAEVSRLEDKADTLCKEGKDTAADMLIAATGILRDCLESDGSTATVVVETRGIALLVAALASLTQDTDKL